MQIDEVLKYGTSSHSLIAELVKSRRRLSRDKMQDRYSRWRKDEEAFLFYMPEKDVDAVRRSNRENNGNPEFTTVKIPYDYAALMSAHTYWTSVFLGRDPIFQFQGREGQSQNSVLAIEALINYQMTAGNNIPPLYIWLLDVGKYGIGVMGDFWDVQKNVCTKIVDEPDEFLGVPTGTTTKKVKRVSVESYKGNRFYNVRPYDWYPDPRVTIHRFQDGEFCGRDCQVGWNEILKRVASGKYFNAGYLKNQRQRASQHYDYGSPQVSRPYQNGESGYNEHLDLAQVDLLEMYVEIIPEQFKLGDSSYPETWVFTLANDEIIIGAQPLGLYHNKFPFSVLELEPDGYAMFKRSILEIAGPMTDILTWLVNTHFYNTRKSLNDMWVVDPSKIVLKDLTNPKAGKIIRLKTEMFGQDVRSAITQFPTSNVTQSHMGDTQAIASMLQRITGVNDAMMGLAGQKGRQTATEIRTSSTFGVNRMKTIAEWFSATGFSSLGYMMVANTQQLYDTNMKLRLAGDVGNYPNAQGVMEVTPEAIAGAWDFVPVDGALPIDRFAQVNMWTTLMQQMAADPRIMQTFDTAKIFSWIAQLGGLKNINQFKMEVQDTASLQQEAQAGNVVPIDGRTNSGGAAGQNAGTPVPAQVPAVGPSG